MGKRLPSLVGQVFGHLTVVAPSAARRIGAKLWDCRCTCGTVKPVSGAHLRSGFTVSCGCRQGIIRGEQLRRHGENGRTAEHKVWGSMHSRCRSARKDYGGRDITVCARWSGPQGFQNFLEDMGRRPGPGYWIERKDNDGNYEPSNCVWATTLEQGANKRNNRKVTFNGETLHLAEWARRTGISDKLIGQRLKAGWSVERALTTPHRKTR